MKSNIMNAATAAAVAVLTLVLALSACGRPASHSSAAAALAKNPAVTHAETQLGACVGAASHSVHPVTTMKTCVHRDFPHGNSAKLASCAISAFLLKSALGSSAVDTAETKCARQYA